MNAMEFSSGSGDFFLWVGGENANLQTNPVATVDIITRTKDRPLLLERTLRSVVRQDFQDWNLMLINSGDPEPVDRLLESFGEKLDGRVTRIEAQGETSLGRLLNLGAKTATGKYIVVLDDDDTWETRFLSRCVHAIEHPFHEAVKGIVTKTWVIQETIEDGEIIEERAYGLDDDMRNLSIFRMAGMNRYSPNSFMYRRDVYEGIGYFDEDLPVLEDWEFNLRFIMAHEIQIIPEYLAIYHLRPNIREGVDSNTQFWAQNKHIYFETHLINHMLRKELAEGRVGLGFLMSHSHALRDLSDKFRRLQKKLESVSDKVGKINSRSQAMKDRLMGE